MRAEIQSADITPQFVFGHGINFIRGKFFTYSWTFLLTVELFCLQFTEVLIRYTFPL